MNDESGRAWRADGCVIPSEMSTLLVDTIFFFQAEDGIRDRNVTGVQTCALPICASSRATSLSPTTVTAVVVAVVGDKEVARLEARIPVRDPGGPTPADPSSVAVAPPTLAEDRVVKKIGRASCRGRVEAWGGREVV